MTEKQLFFIYFALRLTALVLGGIGVWALSRGATIGALAVTAAVLSLLVRPKHLGLTRR